MNGVFDPKPYLMDLKGKKYLQVAYRILWLNEEAKAGNLRFSLMTELVKESEWKDARGRDVKEAVFKATVVIKDAQGSVLKEVVGWGSETSTDFGDFREKAETKAIGRALALAGFGTQFAVADFEEGEGISPVDGTKGPAVVDSPVKMPKKVEAKAPAQKEGDEKDEIIKYLQSKASNPEVVKIIREALTKHGVSRVSELSLEALKELKASV